MNSKRNSVLQFAFGEPVYLLSIIFFSFSICFNQEFTVLYLRKLTSIFTSSEYKKCKEEYWKLQWKYVTMFVLQSLHLSLSSIPLPSTFFTRSIYLEKCRGRKENILLEAEVTPEVSPCGRSLLTTEQRLKMTDKSRRF